MNILLQPSSGKEASEHFEDTVESGVSLQLLRDTLDGELPQELVNYPSDTVRTWGMVSSETGDPVRKEYRELNKGDLVLFYKNRGFFFLGRVVAKVRNKELATQLWGVDDKGRTWELMYFFDQGMEINMPYEPGVLHRADGQMYSDAHIVQGASLLSGDNADSMNRYIQSYVGDLVDEKLLEKEIVAQDTTTKNVVATINTPEEADAKLREIVQGLPKKQRVVVTRSYVRNAKIARWVKERVKYTCEWCGAEPFEKRNGLPYAEAHHVDELVGTGTDMPSNIMCVCPTCHRVFHHGSKEALNSRRNKHKTLN